MGRTELQLRELLRPELNTCITLLLLQPQLAARRRACTCPGKDAFRRQSGLLTQSCILSFPTLSTEEAANKKLIWYLNLSGQVATLAKLRGTLASPRTSPWHCPGAGAPFLFFTFSGGGWLAGWLRARRGWAVRCCRLSCSLAAGEAKRCTKVPKDTAHPPSLYLPLASFSASSKQV